MMRRTTSDTLIVPRLFPLILIVDYPLHLISRMASPSKNVNAVPLTKELQGMVEAVPQTSDFVQQLLDNPELRKQFQDVLKAQDDNDVDERKLQLEAILEEEGMLDSTPKVCTNPNAFDVADYVRSVMDIPGQESKSDLKADETAQKQVSKNSETTQPSPPATYDLVLQPSLKQSKQENLGSYATLTEAKAALATFLDTAATTHPNLKNAVPVKDGGSAYFWTEPMTKMTAKRKAKVSVVTRTT